MLALTGIEVKREVLSEFGRIWVEPENRADCNNNPPVLVGINGH